MKFNRPLKLGTRGADVAQWQKFLAVSGYPVRADGVFGPSTAAATRQLQQRLGLKPDGVVGLATLRALGGAVQKAPEKEFERILRAGLSGSDVLEWQRMLKAAGYRVSADGKFGAATTAATKELQRRHGLKVDGLVGPKTVDALEHDLPADLVAGDHADQVGSLWSKLKKGVKKIGRKVGKIVKSPVFAVVNPSTALAIHSTKKAITGKGVYSGALGRLADAGTSAALSVVPGGGVANKALAVVQKSGGLTSIAKGGFGAIASSVAKTAQGSAFVFPSSGVPALRAVSTANRLVADARRGTPAALGVISRTRALARSGNAGAQRAVSLLATAARARTPAAAPRPPVRATPRPVARPPVRAVPRPATPASSPSSAPVVQGFLIHTAGPNRGRIDFTSGRWARA